MDCLVTNQANHSERQVAIKLLSLICWWILVGSTGCPALFGQGPWAPEWVSLLVLSQCHTVLSPLEGAYRLSPVLGRWPGQLWTTAWGSPVPVCSMRTLICNLHFALCTSLNGASTRLWHSHSSINHLESLCHHFTCSYSNTYLPSVLYYSASSFSRKRPCPTPSPVVRSIPD